MGMVFVCLGIVLIRLRRTWVVVARVPLLPALTVFRQALLGVGGTEILMEACRTGTAVMGITRCRLAVGVVVVVWVVVQQAGVLWLVTQLMMPVATSVRLVSTAMRRIRVVASLTLRVRLS